MTTKFEQLCRDLKEQQDLWERYRSDICKTLNEISAYIKDTFGIPDFYDTNDGVEYYYKLLPLDENGQEIEHGNYFIPDNGEVPFVIIITLGREDGSYPKIPYRLKATISLSEDSAIIRFGVDECIAQKNGETYNYSQVTNSIHAILKRHLKLSPYS